MNSRLCHLSCRWDYFSFSDQRGDAHSLGVPLSQGCDAQALGHNAKEQELNARDLWVAVARCGVAVPSTHGCSAQHPRARFLQTCQQLGRPRLRVPVVPLRAPRGALRKAIGREDLHISHRV